MDILQVASVPLLTSIVYCAIEIYKYAVGGKEKYLRLVPVWAAILGVGLGMTAFYAVPELIAADNVLAAILTGIASGLAATGTNQMFKQLNKIKTDCECKAEKESNKDKTDINPDKSEKSE